MATRGVGGGRLRGRETERPHLGHQRAQLRAELAAGRSYLPAGPNVLRAFTRPLARVRVLIVGQDPYPTPGHAVGAGGTRGPGSGDSDGLAAGPPAGWRWGLACHRARERRGDRRGGQKGHCCNGAGNAKRFEFGGELYLPTRSGLVVMSTEGIVKNEVAPRSLIERVRVGEPSDPRRPEGPSAGTAPGPVRTVRRNPRVRA